MVAPCIYWAGIGSAVFFEHSGFVRSVMLAGTPLSEILNLVVLVGFPMMALLINIKARFQRSIQEESLNPRADKVQLVLILAACILLTAAFEYTFFERLDMWQYVIGAQSPPAS